MKRIHLTLVLATVFCVAGFAAQANAGPVGTLEFNLGYAKSSTEVMPDESMGGGLAFGAGYWRSASPSVQWGVEASYDNLGSVEYDNGNTTDNTISSSLVRVTPALRMNFGSMVGPNFFAQGGAGLYNVSANVEDSVFGNVDDSSSEFGFNLGAGVGFPVGPKTRMNVQGQYHSVATEGESTNYLAFRAGIGIGL
jgi:outer membrane protein with beta-barrel domain